MLCAPPDQALQDDGDGGGEEDAEGEAAAKVSAQAELLRMVMPHSYKSVGAASFGGYPAMEALAMAVALEPEVVRRRARRPAVLPSRGAGGGAGRRGRAEG